MLKTEITRQDILPPAEFGKVRADRRRTLVEHKRNRRIGIGPDATCYFESYETMWWQVHEMLYIEKGGEDQIADELAAYNPMIPKGQDLSCTVMFEIDEPARRAAVLSKLGGVEETMFLEFGGEVVAGTPEADVERTNADGKASSVQFIHFHLTEPQIAKFREPGARIVIGFRHPAYSHMAVMPEEMRLALAADFAP